MKSKTPKKPPGKQLAVVNNLKPPATRGETMAALVQIRMEQITKARRAEVEMHGRLKAEIRDELIAHFESIKGSLKPSLNMGYMGSNNGKPYSVEIRFSMDKDIPAATVEKMRKMNSLPDGFREPRLIDVRVDLRRLNAGVPEHFLHDSQIGSAG